MIIDFPKDAELDPLSDFIGGIARFHWINVDKNNPHMEGREFGIRKTYWSTNNTTNCMRCEEELSWCDCTGYWY